jgi:hypothetical protein
LGKNCGVVAEAIVDKIVMAARQRAMSTRQEGFHGERELLRKED